MVSLSILDIEELAEGCDVEAKQAFGKDGQGELPKSFFQSYSAMANTYGGAIFLGTVALEGKVTHARLKCMSTTHPHDLTKALSALVRDGFLESGGIARGTFYFFPGEPPNTEVDLVAQNYKFVEKTSPDDLLSKIILKENFDDLQPSSDDLEFSSDDLQPSSDDWESLKEIAANIRNKGKVASEVMETTILKLCQGRFLNHKQLQELLGRSYNTLRLGYLSKMQKTGQLELRYPDKPTHPEQGYRTKQ